MPNYDFCRDEIFFAVGYRRLSRHLSVIQQVCWYGIRKISERTENDNINFQKITIMDSCGVVFILVGLNMVLYRLKRFYSKKEIPLIWKIKPIGSGILSLRKLLKTSAWVEIDFTSSLILQTTLSLLWSQQLVFWYRLQ